MRKSLLLIILPIVLLVAGRAYAQDSAAADTTYNPTILFTGIPNSYRIAGIEVEGVNNYDPQLIQSWSGLKVGEWVYIPGAELTAAAKRLWR
ncbi:MAG: outer membrane protein assembly factor BamA, partial [Paramuribaculum sp.]|nr:outer membrane protein assembly factor BamA [Paramuribaculum sp.]